jgi:hypothetical protein
MQFSDLTNKEVISEGLFDKIVSMSKSKTFDIDSFESWIKSNEKPTNNTAKKLIGVYTPDHVWNKRDLGKEVSGFSNARNIISLTSNYKRIIQELNKLQLEYDKAYGKFIDRCKEIAHEYRTDNFADADKVAISYVAKANKTRESDLSVIDKKVEHYKTQFSEAVQEMKQYEAALAAARSKKQVSDIRMSHKNRSKVMASTKTDSAYDSKNWKCKVKMMVKAKDDNTDGANG